MNPGGSQIVSFPPVAHKCSGQYFNPFHGCPLLNSVISDTTALVSRSIVTGKPIVIVTFNYRLNIFGFGDGTQKNLALKDQRLAIDWVVKHISHFGGDKVFPLTHIAMIFMTDVLI